MAFLDDARGRRLLRLYLDPAAPWDARRDGDLRARLRISPALREAYDRAVLSHRLLTTGDPSLPSGFESRRMREAVVEGALRGVPPGVRERGYFPRTRAAMLAAAALAAVFLLTLPSGSPPDHIRSRGEGAGVERPLTGLGVSGVTEDGDELEVVASGEAPLSGWLRFYWSNDRPEIRHVFVAGLQEHRAPVWYAPLPPEESESLPIGTGRSVPLPFESRVAARHAPGPVKIVALFTARPIAAAAVARALDPSLFPLPGSALETVLRHRLALEDRDVVQLLETRIAAPSGEEGPHDER